MKIRAIRKRAGISQAELARRTGMDQSTISRIESGKQEMSVKQLIRIVKACGYRGICLRRHKADQDQRKSA